MKRFATTFLLLSVALLAACAPGARDDGPRLSVEQFTGDVSFYPHATGAAWAYVPEGGQVEGSGLAAVVEGPRVINDDIWVATEFIGLGIDGALYRQYRADGVFTLREDASGSRTVYNPPLQEYPPESELRVGATWSGETTANVFFPSAERTADRNQTFEVTYSYTVVDKRKVRLPIGELEVYVINRIGRAFNEEGDVADQLTQEIWFSPFVGEVRTREGLFLARTNVRSREASN